MFNHESSHPEYFKELCALAASGQISEAEFVELQDHMEQCAYCRSAYDDFADLLHNKLPLADPELTGSSRLPRSFSENSSYRERFLTRARKQGIAISGGSLRDTRRSKWGIWLWIGMGYPLVAALAMGLLLATVGILGYGLRQSNVRYKTLVADLEVMNQRFNQQSSSAPPGPVLETQPGGPSSRETARRQSAASPSDLVSNAELLKARKDRAAAEARSKDLEAQLQKAAVELEALRAQQEQASDSRNQLEKKLREAEKALTRAGGELEEIRQARSDDAATIAGQGVQIRELSEKLSEQTEALERERALLAAGRDIHDLMGARNLHVVDVLDVDSKGKDSRTFGRVFYTEGKSLIFYAYDLGDRTTTKRNVSFQVWGAREPAQTRAQSLGIFYVDNQKQNRWVLKFEDPTILQEIDSVFVTVEPHGGSTRPTGRRLLYAYLKGNPNHS